jgi:dihydrofolate reductase
MARPATAAFLGMSLDGFIAGPDDELDWLERGGPSEDHGFTEFFGSVDAILVGRRTWEVVSRFPAWPYDGKKVFVLTRRPAEGRHGERFLAGTPADVLATLDGAGTGKAYVDGGRVVSQVLAAGLLDELTISILPVVLGRGIRLLGDTGPERWLSLASSKVFASGMVQLRYVARTSSPPGRDGR